MSNRLYVERIFLAAALLACAIPAPAQTAAPTGVIVSPARTERLTDRVEALGTLRAIESVTLTASVTETVTDIRFDDGERVEAGQVLVEMTSAEEHALLEEARATVDEAKRQYQRVKSLARQGTAARSLLDQRRREWDTARARLGAIESRLADRLVKAPFAGVVGLRNISLGALVEPGEPITTLDDDRTMKLDFAIPSVFLRSVQPGMTVVARSRAYGKREFQGEVRSIDSRVDPVTRSVIIRGILPNPDRALKPGMLMEVDLQTNPREALVIPEEALVPMGTQQTVLVVEESRAIQRDVSIGTRRPGEVEVLVGLNAGEQVITHGAVKVRPGQAVAVRMVDDGSRSLAEMLKSLDDMP
ncbi:MAG: efflux RND transporter periplasmic adaptor subunit [Gammaproteobacteria bacterium]|nr:efflux RND transporter periplasmic adaptor subunit [Gammaproteobacteria bacterium]